MLAFSLAGFHKTSSEALGFMVKQHALFFPVALSPLVHFARLYFSFSSYLFGLVVIVIFNRLTLSSPRSPQTPGLR